MMNSTVDSDLVHAQLADLFDDDPAPTIVLCDEGKLYYHNTAGMDLLQKKFINETKTAESELSLFSQLSAAAQKEIFAEQILPNLDIAPLLSDCGVQPLSFSSDGQTFKRFSLPPNAVHDSDKRTELKTMLLTAWHDIRNLLGITRNQIELMQISDETLPEPVIERLRKIDAASQTACVIAEKMTSVQAEHVPVQDCNVLLNSAAVVVLGLVPDHMQLKIEIWPETLPVKLSQADFNNALINLVLNAVEACEEGCSIHIKCFEQFHPLIGRAVCVQVIDDGCGIDDSRKQEVRNIFQSNKTGNQQHGLGLFSVEQFVTNAGGLLDIADNFPAGAQISLFLPWVINE
ncbi:MAG: ATP-binding protein [Methylophaga sp.]|nr:ATP-binding protein [Methylophaga sp.]